MSFNDSSHMPSLLSSGPWELTPANGCLATYDVIPTTATSVTTQTIQQGLPHRQYQDSMFNRHAPSSVAFLSDSKVALSISAGVEADCEEQSSGVPDFALSMIGNKKNRTISSHCATVLSSHNTLSGWKPISRSHDRLLRPTDVLPLVHPAASLSVAMSLWPSTALSALEGANGSEPVPVFHTMSSAASSVSQVCRASDSTQPLGDYIHPCAFSRFNCAPGDGSLGRSTTTLGPALTSSPRVEGSGSSDAESGDNDRLEAAGHGCVLGGGDGGGGGGGGGSGGCTSPVLLTGASAAVLPGNVRQANGRLSKYRAKIDQLRRLTSSKCKMLGALCVHRNHLTSDLVTMLRLVKTSRQRLDEQRVANKNLMKYIDSLTDPDVSAAGVKSGTAAGDPTFQQNNLPVCGPSADTAKGGNKMSGNSTADLAQDGNNNAGTRNIGKGGAVAVTDRNNDVAGNCFEFAPNVKDRVEHVDPMKCIDCRSRLDNDAVGVWGAASARTPSAPACPRDSVDDSGVSKAPQMGRNISSGNNTVDVEQDGKSILGFPNAAASGDKAVPDAGNDVVGNDFDFDPEMDVHNDSDADSRVDLVLATAGSNSVCIHPLTESPADTNKSNDVLDDDTDIDPVTVNANNNAVFALAVSDTSIGVYQTRHSAAAMVMSKGTVGNGSGLGPGTDNKNIVNSMDASAVMRDSSYSPSHAGVYYCCAASSKCLISATVDSSVLPVPTQAPQFITTIVTATKILF